MPDHFFLRLEQHGLAGEEPSASWCFVPVDGEALSGRGSLVEAAEACHHAHITLIVPGALCPVVQASLPGVGRNRLAKALPYALEEQLIDDVEELHFAPGELKEGGVPVVVVRREVLDQWLSLLEQHNMIPQRVIPDYFVIPSLPQGWQLWFDEGVTLLRSQRDSGMSIALTTPMLILQQLYDESEEKPEQLRVSGDSEKQPDELASWCEKNGVELLQDETPAALLPVAAATLSQERVINLLQGAYSHQEKTSRLWRPWWPAVAVLAVMVVSLLISMGGDHQRLSATQMALDQEIKQLYLDTFPDAKRVVDPRAQMEARLKAQVSGTEGDQFYQLLGGITLLSDNEVSFELQRLRYQNGELSVDMHLKNLQILDQIKQLFADKKGLQAEVVSASARGNKVEARLLIKGTNS